MNAKHLFYLNACLFSALATATATWQGRYHVKMGQIFLAIVISLFLWFARRLFLARASINTRAFPRQLIASLFTVYLLAVASTYFFQDVLLFVPVRGHFGGACAPAKRLGYETVKTQFEGSAIRMLLKRSSADAGWILVFHGNAESACSAIVNYDEILSKLPLNVAAVEYPGYLDVGVKASQALLTQNALASFDYVRSLSEKRVGGQNLDAQSPGSMTLDRQTKNRPRVPIYAFGRSLGTGVATFVASERDVAGLILISPYPSISEVAGYQYPFIPTRWLLRNTFPAREWAAKVKAPVLAFHGDADRVIPIELGRIESKLFPKLDSMIELPGADHNTLLKASKTVQAVQKFVSKAQLP